MTKKKKIFTAIVVAAVCAAAVLAPCLRTKKPAFSFNPAEHRFKAVNIVSTYIALIEKPEARSALLADSGAELLRAYFERAGVECAAPGAEGEFDIVVATSPKPADWKSLAKSAGENGLLLWLMDVRKTSIATFKERVEAFPCGELHFWMPGETDWVFSGRMKPAEVKLSDMLEVFVRDGAFQDLADGCCDTVSDVFASFAGYRETIEPAFSGNLAADVKPEYFITKDVPDIPWITAGDMDEDILIQNAREVRSRQIIRRTVIEGNMLSQEGKAEEAIDKWSAALLRNPRDTMLLDRLYRLAVNARTFQKVGNLKAAAKCYETMVGIRPADAAAMYEYGMCMASLGEKEISEKALERAKELVK